MRLSRRFASLVLALALFSCRAWGQNAAPQPELKTAHAVAVKYYLSLPTGWTADKTWPIVVTLDGSGHKFADNIQGFMKARGNRPFILVTPVVTSNGNDPAETASVLAIVKEVRAEEHGQAKFFVTGFSSGGHMTWQFALMHPELLAGAVLASAAFVGRGIAEISDAPERVQLPIHAVIGDKDPSLKYRTEQWDEAEKLARAHGYQNLSRVTIAGGVHSAFPAQSLDFFASLLPP